MCEKHMRVLVTGAGGFMGPHLIRELIRSGHQAPAFYGKPPPAGQESGAGFVGDLRDAAVVNRVVASIRPDACAHLAAVSFVPVGAADPYRMLSVNIMGTVNVLEAFRRHSPESRILVVSTAHVYGMPDTGELLTEDSPIAPAGMYAVSKAAADLAALAYAGEYSMRVMTARPNNHTGPGQSPRFVVPSFARQIKAVAAGMAEPMLKVGNLESERDFSDVRDVARAYRMLIEKGRAGCAYNISSQTFIRIGTILEMLLELAGVAAEFVVDRQKFRPTDKSPSLDVSRLRRDTGWKPEIDISATLCDMLDSTTL